MARRRRHLARCCPPPDCQDPLHAIQSFFFYQPIGATVAGRWRVGMGGWLAAPVGVTLVCSIIPAGVAVVLAMRVVDFMLLLLVALLTLLCCAVPLNAARARRIAASWAPA